MERSSPGLQREPARFIDQLGRNRVTLRCDSEPAMEALAREIAQARQEGSQTVPERPPVGESQSNGIIERAAGLVAGQARTLKAALERRRGTRVPPDARILCWLVEFGAYLMNRCDVGTDGKTPLQWLHEGTTHRFWSLEKGSCTCQPSHRERGNRASIRECLWRC